MKKVYVVNKNADFTEGRGPMLLHRVFSTFSKAEDYIMAQEGIFGSAQRKGGQSRLFGSTFTHYNGYQIVEIEVE